MMGFQGTLARLFYDFCLEEHVPVDHMLRGIDRHLALDELRQLLKPFYSQMGRPSIDPELMIRMLIVGYSFGIRSERRLCDEVHPNLAYRWFCRLGLDGDVPDHSTFSKNRHGRFRESDLLRKLFETVVARCMKEGVVGRSLRGRRQYNRGGRASTAKRRQGRRSSSDFEPRGRRISVGPRRCGLQRGNAGRAEGDLANRSGGPLHRFGQFGRRLCLLRQLSHRLEACSDYGCRGDDNHSPSGSWRGQDDARPHGWTVRRYPVAPGRGWGLRLGRYGRLAGG